MPTDVRPERLFAPLGPTYERAGALLSFGLEEGWRRTLVDRATPRDGDVYLDVATGTGLVARALRARADVRVVGLDLTPAMIGAADRADGIRFVLGRAESLPFADATFDGLTVAYLLRYVDDPVATMRELARVVRPGGRIAMLEFARPRSVILRAGWWLYTRVALPLLGSLISRDWRSVGAFLGPSIDHFYARYDMEQVWQAAGISGVTVERLGMGAAGVTSGVREARERIGNSGQEGPETSGAPLGRDPRQRRDPASGGATPPAFYALPSGGWRDYITLLHPPYTLWHLSYVVLGTALASEVRIDRLAGTLVAFFFALGIGAHALDELNGRPLRTRIPAPLLRVLAVGGLGAAIALGVVAAQAVVGPGLYLFIAAGIVLAFGYPLELAGGRLHSDLWFAVAWGAFPVLTASYASGGSVTPAAVVGAAYAIALSYAQRVLSTWVRMLRRRTATVVGEIGLTSGERIVLDRGRLIAAPESGLQWLTAVSVLVALAALAARLVR